MTLVLGLDIVCLWPPVVLSSKSVSLASENFSVFCLEGCGLGCNTDSIVLPIYVLRKAAFCRCCCAEEKTDRDKPRDDNDFDPNIYPPPYFVLNFKAKQGSTTQY